MPLVAGLRIRATPLYCKRDRRLWHLFCVIGGIIVSSVAAAAAVRCNGGNRIEEGEEGGRRRRRRRQYNWQYIYTTISLEQSHFYDPSIPPTRFRLIFVENHLNNNTIDHRQPDRQRDRSTDHIGTRMSKTLALRLLIPMEQC